MQDLTGQTVSIAYFDHNEVFKHQLPTTGVVVSRLASSKTDDWYLLKLDEPVQWEGSDYGHLLIRSRWKDQAITDPEGTSVFLLLVPDGEFPLDEPIDPEEYIHVAWGFATAGDS